MNILEVNKITQHFGELRAVDNLSFAVEKGEMFGIAGPNGAGKSTLFNMITGFYHYSGEIIFDKVNITKLKPHQICHKGIALTFQIPQLFPTMPVFENLKIGAHFGVHIHGSRNEEQDIEGFGIVFLEANYFKVPVIGTATGGISEAIIDGETGFLIKQNDINDLVEKIIFLYNN